ncbi:MAG TPA: phosphate ABC transporter permease subunit PstC, partial [Armatimonadota bacterium]
MLVATLFSGGLVLGMGVLLYLHARPLLAQHSVWELLLGNRWQPAHGQFGFLPFLVGTFWVTGLALLLAVPLCLLAAIYLAEYARPRVRQVVKPLIDLLAGIPSVVYGMWGMLVVVPFIA